MCVALLAHGKDRHCLALSRDAEWHTPDMNSSCALRPTVGKRQASFCQQDLLAGLGGRPSACGWSGQGQAAGSWGQEAGGQEPIQGVREVVEYESAYELWVPSSKNMCHWPIRLHL